MIIQGRVTKVIKREGVNESTGNPWKRVEFIVEFKEYATDKAYDRVALESWHENVVNNIKEDMIVKLSVPPHRFTNSILIAYSFLLCISIPTANTAAIIANNQYIMLSVSTAKNASSMTMKIKISLNVDCFIFLVFSVCFSRRQLPAHQVIWMYVSLVLVFPHHLHRYVATFLSPE